MALQKKNEILRSHIVVCLFWFCVIFLAKGNASLFSFSRYLSFSLSLTLSGLLLGIATWWSAYKIRRESIIDSLQPSRSRGVTITVGGMPKYSNVDRKTQIDMSPLEKTEWWADYKKDHEKYANALLAVYSVMLTKPSLPASPVKGGHGDRTLIEHSLNVVDTMLKMAPSWRYKGHKNKEGKISFGLINPLVSEHRFSMNDPILILTAFAHDIGKVPCYELQSDGAVDVIKRDHDIEGSKVLRALPEVMALAWSESMSLIIATEFYHHIGSLPQSLWIDDRARSLIELLIAADMEAGRIEGGVIESYEQVEDDQEDDIPDIEEDDDESLPPTPDEDLARKGTPFDTVNWILGQSGRVNGNNPTLRIGWKHGEWLYIRDQFMRNAAAQVRRDPSISLTRGNKSSHTFTRELLAQLEEKKALYQDHEGMHFNSYCALFNTESQGNTKVESNFVLIAKADAFPSVKLIPDCAHAPIITRCAFGNDHAVGKNNKKNNTEEYISDNNNNNATLAIDVSGDSSLDSNGSESSFTDDFVDASASDSGADYETFASDSEMEVENDLVIKGTEEMLRNAVKSMAIPTEVKDVGEGAMYTFEMEDVAEVFPNVLFSEGVEGVTVIKTSQNNKFYLGIKK